MIGHERSDGQIDDDHPGISLNEAIKAMSRDMTLMKVALGEACAMVVLDLQGNVVDGYGAVAQTLGWTLDELRGQSLLKMIDPDRAVADHQWANQMTVELLDPDHPRTTYRWAGLIRRGDDGRAVLVMARVRLAMERGRPIGLLVNYESIDSVGNEYTALDQTPRAN